jgi:hypothetical protein
VKDLMQVLQEIGEFEWASRRPTAEASGAELAYPPIICWRYKQPTAEKAELLQCLLAGFERTIAWELQVAPKPRAWVLMPAWVREYAEKYKLVGSLQAADELMRKDVLPQSDLEG